MKSIRKNITQPEDWWAAFEAAAQTENMTLSEWVGECCRANIKSELSDRPPTGRPPELLHERGG